jgi:hypothetical protein
MAADAEARLAFDEMSQPEPQAAKEAGNRLIGLLEGTEYFPECLRLNADAAVRDVDKDAARFIVRPQADFAPLWAEF